jgi:signal transduction histidine kinase
LFNNIGNILVEKGKIDEGIQHHVKALNIQQELGDTSSIFTSTLSLTQAYTFKGDYAKALEYGNISKQLLNSSETGVKMLIDYHQVMGELYKKKGDYKNAIDAYTEYNRYKDSMIHSENNAVVTEMQVKYETEKKDLEIANKTLALNKASYEVQKRNAIAIGLIVMMMLLAIVGYLSYSRYKLKKRKELDAEIIRQQELRSKAIIEAEEKERIRIAKDLHDGVGQQLSAVKLRLSMLRNNHETFEDNCSTLVQMVDDAVKEVRGVSHDMMPNALLRSGLAAATREFIDKIAGIDVLKVDLQIIGLNERLDGTTETILYRVLQESVNNIIKHANATKVSIQLIKDENELSLVLEDNGRGFDVNKVNSFSGIGLKNIISRIEYLNGKVNFDSTIGKGTTMIVEVPLNTVV